MAPVSKDDSFTLVQEGLAHFLKNKYYHRGIRGEKYYRGIREVDVVSNIRTNEVRGVDQGGMSTHYLPLSVVLAGRPCSHQVQDPSDDAAPAGMNAATKFSCV